MLICNNNENILPYAYNFIEENNTKAYHADALFKVQSSAVHAEVDVQMLFILFLQKLFTPPQRTDTCSSQSGTDTLD